LRGRLRMTVNRTRTHGGEEDKGYKAKPSDADDILISLQEALKYARGEKADVIVHRVVPRASVARKARMKLGLSQRLKRP